jgi:hypothetical protein
LLHRTILFNNEDHSRDKSFVWSTTNTSPILCVVGGKVDCLDISPIKKTGMCFQTGFDRVFLLNTQMVGEITLKAKQSTA